MSYKSRQSCMWSIELLGGRVNGQRAKRLYMWTFTFADVESVSTASRRWAELQRALCRHNGFSGVRVYELHDAHGMHIHVVVPERYDVRVVRGFCQVYGFGRVHVCRLRQAAWSYITKYLTKGSRAACMKGRRLWACIGGFKGAKVKDCECVEHPVKAWYDRIDLHMLRVRFHRDIEAGYSGNCLRYAYAKYLHFMSGFLPDGVELLCGPESMDSFAVFRGLA